MTAPKGPTLRVVPDPKTVSSLSCPQVLQPSGWPIPRGYANGMAAEVKAAFRNRPHLVEGASGYVRMEVISPLELSAEIWLITFWTDEPSFHEWHHSHLYHGSHSAIPKGLKLVPGETQIRKFEHVAS